MHYPTIEPNFSITSVRRYETMLVSVIMPCYNAKDYICEAINSVFGQTYPSVELIVVDDGSSDGSCEILQQLSQRYAGSMTVLHQNNKGPYPARNLALKHAKGEYVAFLDADDYWRKDCLEKLQQAVSLNNVDLAYCGWQNVGEGSPGNLPYIPPQYENHDPVQLFMRKCPWPIHAALVRHEIVEVVKGFSERKYSSMDYDFWLRILSVTRKLFRVPEVLAFYRWHDKGQISSVKWRQVFDAWHVRRDFVQNNPELVAHIPDELLRTLTNQCLLDAGYTAYWERDLTSAQKLFRQALKIGYWGIKDIKYILPAVLPEKVYQSLIKQADD